MTTGESIVSTRWTFVGKVMSLLFSRLFGLVYSFSSKEQVSFYFMAAVTTCSNFRAQGNKGIHVTGNMCYRIFELFCRNSGPHPGGRWQLQVEHRISGAWETWLQSLVQEDSTCHRAIKSIWYNYSVQALEPMSRSYWACLPQLLRSLYLQPVLCIWRSHGNRPTYHSSRASCPTVPRRTAMKGPAQQQQQQQNFFSPRTTGEFGVFEHEPPVLPACPCNKCFFALNSEVLVCFVSLCIWHMNWACVWYVPRDYHTQWNKPDRGNHICMAHMWNLKRKKEKIQVNLFTWQK